MKDPLEQFILENRSEFDIFEPNSSVWQKIEKRESDKKNKTIGFKSIFWKAAAVIVLFLSGFMLHYYTSQPSVNREAEFINKQEEIVIPELAEAELFYTTKVNNALSEVEEHLVGKPDLKKDLNCELHELDSVYTELKSDLKEGLASKEVINAMIQNYRIKLEILEDLLKQLKKAENRTERQNEKEKPQYQL